MRSPHCRAGRNTARAAFDSAFLGRTRLQATLQTRFAPAFVESAAVVGSVSACTAILPFECSSLTAFASQTAVVVVDFHPHSPYISTARAEMAPN